MIEDRSLCHDMISFERMIKVIFVRVSVVFHEVDEDYSDY